MEWLKDIRMEDLPESYREMAELIGLEHTITLAQHYNKQGFYFSGIDALISAKKREFILRHRGRPARELARLTGWSERQVYNVLEEERDSRQQKLL